MTASAVLKKVRQAYPEVFEKLAKPRLKLVEEAILFASKLSEADELLSESEHRKLLVKLTGVEKLSAGQRLRAYRLREGMSQSEVGKKSGIPQANISAMESGHRPIGVQIAKKLAKALRCDFRQLV